MSPNYLSPDNVLVVTFGDDPENDKNAYQALTDLQATRHAGPDQDRRRRRSHARPRRSRRDQERGRRRLRTSGTASGGLIGLLVGIIGGPLGVLIGGTTGVLVGSLFDIDDAETTESVLSRHLEAGSARRARRSWRR